MSIQREEVSRSAGFKTASERLNGNDIRFVYFDIGGVIFDFEPGIHNLANLLGTDFENCKRIFKKYDPIICRGEITPQELWTNYKTETGYKGKDINFAEFWSDQFVPIPQVHEFIRDLSRNRAVGLLTNIYPGVFPLMIKKNKIPNIPYVTVVQSCKVGLIKPEEGFLLLAEKKSGVKPNEIMLLDDVESNIAAVRKREWNGVLFDRRKPEEAIQSIKFSLGI